MDGPREPGEGPRAKTPTADLRYLDVGWIMLGSVTAGVLGGYLLDRWLQTAPWCLVGGSLLGIFVGLYELILTAINLGKRRGN